MQMIWEFVFSRYLFGLEREQRLKLRDLEETLLEVGAREAVHQWRATTLTLLSQRPAFREKIIKDTRAVTDEILRHLRFILPPPPQYDSQAITTLTQIIAHAVELSLEMRTQRAEYVMRRAPGLEYDDNGEISKVVAFDANTMHALNLDDLHATDAILAGEKATVKMVLCPLIIRRGNEYGEHYEQEVVVQRMQVLAMRQQLRSESRSSVRTSVSNSWRETEAQKQHVARLTPITDHSPRTTPERTRRPGEEVSPQGIGMGLEPIPERQTVRLVEKG